MTEKFNIGEHLKDLLAMSRTHDDMPTKEITYLMEKLDRSEFWTIFMMAHERGGPRLGGVAELTPDEFIESFYADVQAKDNQERKANGLEPRPWSEIELELEKRLEEVGDGMPEELKAEARKLAEGIEEPGAGEGLGEEMGRGLQDRMWHIQEMVMEYAEQERKNKGLEPSFWKGFMGEFKEALDGLERDGSDGVSALRHMVSLCERADENIRQERDLGLVL
ncbi:MAG: hypothetical protein Q9168_002154 [Polycauliona sp. 1 TL-2023]